MQSNSIILTSPQVPLIEHNLPLEDKPQCPIADAFYVASIAVTITAIAVTVIKLVVAACIGGALTFTPIGWGLLIAGAVLFIISKIVRTCLANECCKQPEIYDVFKQKIGKILVIKDGEEFYLKQLESTTAARAGGGAKHYQIRATLITKTGIEHRVRIKAAGVNEAVINHKIVASQDVICKHMPLFFGACDGKGNTIAAASLEQRTLHPLQPVYIILEDIALGDVSKVTDIKFCKTPALVRNPHELERHKEEHFSSMNNAIAYYFFKGVSSFSFALSTSKCDGIFRSIYRFSSCWNTKSTLRQQLERLDADELENVVSDLKKLQTAVHESHFAFSDASLLLVSSQEKGNAKLKVHLIDMAHGIEETEGIENFAVVKHDAAAAINDLIAFTTELRKTKQTPAIELIPFIKIKL